MLPTELMEHIFKYLNYGELLVQKTVSKRWHSIVEQIIKRKYGWYVKCCKEVPEKWWNLILQYEVHPVNERIRCEDLHAEKNYPSIWKTLYESWNEWLAIKDKTPIIKRTADPRGQNSSIAVEGNIVACGTYDGVIRLYDVTAVSLEPICEIRIPYEFDSRMLFTDRQHVNVVLGKKGNDFVIIEAGRKSVQHWIWNKNIEVDATPQKHQILTNVDTSGHTIVCTSFGYACYATIIESEGTRYCSIVTQNLATGVLTKLRHAIDGEAYLGDTETFAADGNTVSILSTISNPTSDSIVVIVSEISIKDNTMKEVHRTRCKRPNGQFMMFQPDVVACVDHWDTIGFSVSGRKWKLYNTKNDLRIEERISQGRDMIYKVGILALMLYWGDFQIFYIDDIDSLDSKLDAMPSRIVKLHLNTNPHGSEFYPLFAITEYRTKKYLVASARREFATVEL